MDCLFHQCPQDLRTRLIGAMDMVVNECFYRRRFMKTWSQVGLNAAFEDWIANAPKRVPEFLPTVESLVEEIHQWPSKVLPS